MQKIDKTTRRGFMGQVAAGLAISSALGLRLTKADNQKSDLKVVLNPYKAVDWDRVEKHKAALHIHTFQSDGFHSVEEVAKSYKNAGYTIMSITDHDDFSPNLQQRRGRLPEETSSRYPDPKPDNFPANTTYPWTDYGSPSPQELGMIAIEGNELSFGHHINSFYNNAGWCRESVEPQLRHLPGKEFTNIRTEYGDWTDLELQTVLDKGGFAIFNHPSWYPTDHRQPLHFYIDYFKDYPLSSLLGLEITNCNAGLEKYDEGLWDQLLARFMPNRPIWGFGNDDMHRLNVKQTFNLFLLDKLADENVRRAMQDGCFFFSESSRSIDYSIEKFAGFDVFPDIKRIDVDNEKGLINISAENYDRIRWISAPESLESAAYFKTSPAPWHKGKVVHTGETLDIRNTQGIKNYVRVELTRKDGEHTQRTFTNPFGISV